MTQKINVPDLRFPEFSAGWKTTTIGKLGSFYYGKSAPKFSLSEDAPTPCVRYGELYSKYNVVISETISRTNIDPKNLKFSSGGEILVPRVGEDPMDFAKNCCFLPLENVAIGEMISVFNTNQNSLFYTYYFKTMRKQFAKVVEGASVSNLYYSYLEPIKIGEPASKEQQKIAAFLSSVDHKIEQLGEKKALLQDYKKGMMQKLFSQELRFKDTQGNDFPDWLDKRLGDFCDSLSGCPVSGDDISKEDTGLPLLRGINITEGNIRHSQEMDRFHGGKVSGGEKFLLFKGDVVIGMDGSKVGKNIATIKEIDAGSFLIQRVTRLRRNSKNSLQYIYFHIISDRFRRYVDIVNTSSGIPHISLRQINDFEVPMPCPEEQQQIADFLFSIDQKIDLVSTELDYAKNFKKGVLQQMFI